MASQGLLEGVAFVPSTSLTGEGGTFDDSATLPPIIPVAPVPTSTAAGAGSATGETRRDPQSFKAYTVDDVNDNPVMVGLLRLIDVMTVSLPATVCPAPSCSFLLISYSWLFFCRQVKFGAEWGLDEAHTDSKGNIVIPHCPNAIPAWMDAVVSVLRSPDTSINGRLFIVKVRADIPFYCFACCACSMLTYHDAADTPADPRVWAVGSDVVRTTFVLLQPPARGQNGAFRHAVPLLHTGHLLFTLASPFR